jgi:hypothetical protein
MITSLARNYGIKQATRTYTMFCGDDDILSKQYIYNLYKYANEGSLIFCQICDVNMQTGEASFESLINKQLEQPLIDSDNKVKNFIYALSMDACKIAPTKNIKQLQYNELLTSGVDVAFWSEYYVTFKPNLIYAKHEQGYYIRRMTENSLSRQKLSYNFNIEQRLDVIKSLLLVSKNLSNDDKNFIFAAVFRQCGFIITYLKQYPEHYEQLHLSVVTKGIKKFPYWYIENQLNI